MPVTETRMVAPCGINCSTCIAHLRERNICLGCWSDHGYKAKYCAKCSIRYCNLLEQTDSKFCYECSKFPCTRLKQLDKRYRSRYNLSLIGNLQNINNIGLEYFLKLENIKWHCSQCGGTICVHKGYCLKCGK